MIFLYQKEVHATQTQREQRNINSKSTYLVTVKKDCKVTSDGSRVYCASAKIWIIHSPKTIVHIHLT